MGWEALGHWGEDAARIGPLAGGVANDIWSVHVHGHLAVGRLGSRSDADLAWETELLQHLDREGLTGLSDPDDGRPAVRGRLGGDEICGGRIARDGGRLASRRRHAPPTAPVDAGRGGAKFLRFEWPSTPLCEKE
jgi:hypothetical protein